MRKIGTALIASVLSLAMAPAVVAQDRDDDAPVLTYSGEVMVSTGGEYATAANGQIVQRGQSFMVHAGSAATITYEDDCQISYAHPGTYVVPNDCDPAAAYVGSGSGAAGSALMTAGIVGGVVAISAAAIESGLDDSDPAPTPPPTSP